MTAPMLAAVRGRPSLVGLQHSLEQAREVNVNLALELRAERLESKRFAERVRLGVDRIRAAIAADSDLAAVNEAGKLGYEADRRIAQLGSVTL